MASPPPPGFAGVVENPVAEEKGKFLNRAGRLTLVRAVLSSIPTYFLTVFNLQNWAIKQIDKIRRSFLWKGDADAGGGHCLVQLVRVKKPKKLGGLGVFGLGNVQ